MFKNSFIYLFFLAFLIFKPISLMGMVNTDTSISEFKDYQSYLATVPVMSETEATANVATITQDMATQPLLASLKFSELITHSSITPQANKKPKKDYFNYPLPAHDTHLIEQSFKKSANFLDKTSVCVNATFDRYQQTRNSSTRAYEELPPFMGTIIKRCNIPEALQYSSNAMTQFLSAKQIHEVLQHKNFKNTERDTSFPKPLAYFMIETIARKRCYEVEKWEKVIQGTVRKRDEPHLLSLITNPCPIDLSSKEGSLYLQYRNLNLAPELINRNTRYTACVYRTVENLKEDFDKSLTPIERKQLMEKATEKTESLNRQSTCMIS